MLSIAGSDSSGGAGIQADIKTIAAYQLFAQTVITALTAQNTCGVEGVSTVEPSFVTQQLHAVFTDIVPAAVKIGMVSSAPVVCAIAQSLVQFKAQMVVCDPVMVSTSGSRLIDDKAIEALCTHLIPLATVVTPNCAEAEVLCGCSLPTENDRQRAAQELAKRYHVAVLVKGGGLEGTARDVLALEQGTTQWFESPYINTQNTHGTGCTLSSAIACGLAQGQSLPAAIKQAKAYVFGALAAGLALGRGTGPLDHMWRYHRRPTAR